MSCAVVLRGFVERARKVQRLRNKGMEGINCNDQMTSQLIKEYCTLEDDTFRIMRTAFDQYGYSARTFNKLLRIARTFADLEESRII